MSTDLGESKNLLAALWTADPHDRLMEFDQADQRVRGPRSKSALASARFFMRRVDDAT